MSFVKLTSTYTNQQSTNHHLESHFSMLKSIGIDGIKNWGALYLQMQLKSSTSRIVLKLNLRLSN